MNKHIKQRKLDKFPYVTFYDKIENFLQQKYDILENF